MKISYECCKIFGRVCSKKIRPRSSARHFRKGTYGSMKYHSSEGIVQIGNCWIAKSLEEFVQKKLDQEARRAIVQSAK